MSVNWPHVSVTHLRPNLHCKLYPTSTTHTTPSGLHQPPLHSHSTQPQLHTLLNFHSTLYQPPLHSTNLHCKLHPTSTALNQPPLHTPPNLHCTLHPTSTAHSTNLHCTLYQPPLHTLPTSAPSANCNCNFCKPQLHLSVCHLSRAVGSSVRTV